MKYNKAKAVGEPPLCLSPCVFFAVKNAIEAARLDAGTSTYFHLNAPATYDIIQQNCLNDFKQYKLND